MEALLGACMCAVCVLDLGSSYYIYVKVLEVSREARGVVWFNLMCCAQRCGCSNPLEEP